MVCTAHHRGQGYNRFRFLSNVSAPVPGNCMLGTRTDGHFLPKTIIINSNEVKSIDSTRGKV